LRSGAISASESGSAEMALRADDLEAALVSTLQPGQYTAQVRGKGQASGIGVVQVYFIP
jgi:hypothetical protein